jgi:5-methylcytosine-specific restriction endonuclease McrBC regulatory subunit McrC
MKEAREGVPVDLDLAAGDVIHLRSVLGPTSTFELLSTGRYRTLVRRVAGLWALPSGETLTVHPTKGGGADVFAWLCAVDPRFQPVKWRGTAREGSEVRGNVASVVVRAFAALLEEELARAGPRRDYQRRETDTNVVRGTIRWAALARRTSPVPVPCRFWTRDLDTPLNRLFAAAIFAASAHRDLRDAGGTQLERLRGLFGHIPRLPPAWIVDRTRPLPRLEAGFEAPRSLAIAVIEAVGLAHGGPQRALAFSVDLWRIFELTVEAAVLTQSWDQAPEFQAVPPYLADEDFETSRIDALTWLRGEPIVIDAKYATRFSKEHLYQVLAYMKMLGSRRGALVYPAGSNVGVERFWSAPGRPEWEVRLYEVDPVEVASRTTAELERLGKALKAGFTDKDSGEAA